MFRHEAGAICVACRFRAWKNDDTILETTKQAVTHLNDHKLAGHKVPDYAFKRLRKEIGRDSGGRKIKETVSYMKQIQAIVSAVQINPLI
jgi:hypothetical protein